MRWVTEKCPECGEDVHGTLESLQGEALVLKDDGEFHYEGTTEVFWDAEETVRAAEKS